MSRKPGWAVGTCRSCGAPVLWITLIGRDGSRKSHPVRRNPGTYTNRDEWTTRPADAYPTFDDVPFRVRSTLGAAIAIERGEHHSGPPAEPDALPRPIGERGEHLGGDS